MSDPKYIIGIDLGTTHCVVAYTDAVAPEFEEPAVQLFSIPQVVAPGEVKAQPLLPSFLLLPGPHDVPEGSLALPWNAEIDYTVGEYARNRGAELPARLVSSAKSWLSHRGVDRTQPILPFEAPAEAQRVAGGDDGALPASYPRGLEHGDGAGRSRRTLPAPGDLPHRPRLVRRRGARVDGAGRAAGRSAPLYAARRTAGRLLRLARSAERRLAQCHRRGGSHPRLRCGRRHQRLQPDRSGGRRRQPRSATCGRGRSHPARWRQHGPDAGLRRAPSWRSAARRSTTGNSAACGTVAAKPRKSCSATPISNPSR
ncbi:MAG: hypothetical protein R2856_18975 [Caldilineaceae bacterium]